MVSRRKTMRFPVKILATAVLAGSVWSMAGSAGAVPLAASKSLRDASTPLVESVQWRRWGWGGVGLGLAAGAIIGGAIASSAYYGGYGYAYPAYSYGYASYGYAPAYYGYAYAPRVYRRYYRRW